MNDVMLRTPPFMMALGDSVEIVFEEPTDPYDVPSFTALLKEKWGEGEDEPKNASVLREEEPTLKSEVPPKLGLWARLVEYVWALVWGLVTR